MLQTMHQKGQKGFTLVELMIVVAIIGILAAIAIPQFAQYRIRGFNSSALSDVRNLTTAQEAFFADWQVYAITTDGTAKAAGAITAVGDRLVGPSAAADQLIQYVRTAPQSLPVAVGNGVVTEAQVLATTAVSYVVIGKHLQGNTAYGASNNTTAIYRNETPSPGDGDTVNPITALFADAAPHATDNPFAAPWAAQ